MTAWNFRAPTAVKIPAGLHRIPAVDVPADLCLIYAGTEAAHRHERFRKGAIIKSVAFAKFCHADDVATVIEELGSTHQFFGYFVAPVGDPLHLAELINPGLIAGLTE